MATAETTNKRSRRPATVYRPHAVLRWLYHRFFRHISVDDQWSDTVKGVSELGTVVYVMRSLSLLDFLCLDYLTKKFSLPLLRFVNDLGLWILEPFGVGGRRFRLRRRVPEQKALGNVIKDGHSAMLFLRRPPRLGRKAVRRGAALEVDLIETIVASQRQSEETILLVPQTFVWTKRPAQHQPTIVDLLFGPVEWPGRVRVFFQFLFNYRNALLRAGAPFDVAAFLREHPELDDKSAADKIRYALLRRMERERTLVLGPTKKTPSRIQTELLQSRRVRKVIESEARASKKSIASVERKARKILKKLCANQNPYALGVLSRLLDWVWNRIYDGIVVDESGLKELREAARDGTLILMPCHKSHVDYLVLSYVLYQNALLPPLIAAGENLSFWPAGPILRRGGAFFIRRSFKGKKLYSALVDAYLRRLLVEGYPIEFFIEGGRSRTGKLLTPKFGLLSMLIDASLKLPNRKVYFAPVSIGYERIVEQKSYVHELSGGKKEKENLGGLLRSTNILRSKHGRVFVQFAAPIPFEDALSDVWRREEKAPPDDNPRKLSPRQRRTLIQRLAHQVVYQINATTVATPASVCATALLSHPKRGMTKEELVDICGRLIGSLQGMKARLADALLDEDNQVRVDTIEEAIGLFLDSDLITEHEDGIYSIEQERRIELEFYKNNLLHFFVPQALIAASVLASEESAVSRHMLRERVRQLSRLFKHEFMYRADKTFEEIFEAALEAMLQAGDLDEIADHIEAVQRDPNPIPETQLPDDGVGRRGVGLHRSAEMIRTYFESALLTLRSIETMGSDEVSKREWLSQTLKLGHRYHLSGELSLRESVSKPKLEAALLSLRDHKLIRVNERAGTLVLTDDARDSQALAELRSRVESFLP